MPLSMQCGGRAPSCTAQRVVGHLGVQCSAVQCSVGGAHSHSAAGEHLGVQWSWGGWHSGGAVGCMAQLGEGVQSMGCCLEI